MSSLESVAVAMSLGVSRRSALAAFAAGAFGFAGMREASAQVPEVLSGPTKQWRAVGLKMFHPGVAKHTRLLVADRLMGRVQLKGQPAIALVPLILEDKNVVELALYDPPSMKLLHRLALRIGADAVPTAAGIAALPGVSFAAERVRVTAPPVDYTGESDCSAACCWGGSVSGQGACCDSGNPNCGSCCDAGFCPGCN